MVKKKTKDRERNDALGRRNTVFFKVRAQESAPKSKADFYVKIVYGAFSSATLGFVIGITTDFDMLAAALFLIPFFVLFLGLGIFLFKMSLSNLSDYREKISKMSFFSDSREASNKKTATGIVGSYIAPIFNSALPYHLTLVVLTLVSLIFYKYQDAVINEAYISQFAEDIVFQLVAGFLFIILGLLNPRLKTPKDAKQFMIKKGGAVYEFLLDERKLFMLKVVLCLSVIALFVFNKWLFFPSLNTHNPALIGITVTLLLFVVRNIYMMGRYPQAFLKQNLFRFKKSLTLLRGAFFILIIFVPFSVILGMGFNEGDLSPIPLFFTGFNLVAAYMEYALIKDVVSALNGSELSEYNPDSKK